MKKHLLTVFIIALLLGSLPVFKQFEAVDFEGNVLASVSVCKDMLIEIQWIHSVELEPWIERFRVEGDELILDSTSFKAFGAGVPDVEYQEVVIEDGWITYPNINRKMGNVIYNISKVARHRMVINQDVFELYKLCNEDTPVKLHVVKRSLWEQIWK